MRDRLDRLLVICPTSGSCCTHRVMMDNTEEESSHERLQRRPIRCVQMIAGRNVSVRSRFCYRRRNPREAGQSRQRPCGVTPAWPLSCEDIPSARNQRLHVDLMRKAGLQTGPARAAGQSPIRPMGCAPTRRNPVAEPSKQEIEARAYRLWEQAGRPEDREAEFWRLAEQELRNEDKGSPTRTPDTL